jgi:hypothetical protein
VGVRVEVQMEARRDLEVLEVREALDVMDVRRL